MSLGVIEFVWRAYLDVLHTARVSSGDALQETSQEESVTTALDYQEPLHCQRTLEIVKLISNPIPTTAVQDAKGTVEAIEQTATGLTV